MNLPPLLQRKRLLLLGALAVLLLAAIVWSIPRFQDRVFYVNDNKYRLAEHTGNSSVYRSLWIESPITVTETGGGSTYDILIEKERIHVQLLQESEEERVYDIVDAQGNRRAKLQRYGWVEVSQPDGSYAPEFFGYSVTNGQKVPFNTGGHDYPAMTLIEMTDPSLQAKNGKPYYYTLGVILLTGSIIGWRFREFFFKLRYILWVEDPEPTDFYLFMTKIGCIAMAVVGVCFLLGGVISVL